MFGVTALDPQGLPKHPIAIPPVSLGQTDQDGAQIVFVLRTNPIAQGVPCDPKNLSKEPGTSVTQMFRASDEPE
jgi:hypothetical protein